jgi:hypothetical protein
MKKIKTIIIEEIEKLNEILETKIETKYVEIKSNIYDSITYRFKTNSGVSYDLEFYKNEIDSNLLLNNSLKLCDIININCDIKINIIDISFTTTDRLTNNDDISHQEYAKLTNYNEMIELMARISYLINIFINKHTNIKIYCVGNDDSVDKEIRGSDKIVIYQKMYDNIFSNNFKKLFGFSENYKSKEAFYFINKNIIKNK